MGGLVTVSLGQFSYFLFYHIFSFNSTYNCSRVMLGGFPLIIPNDPVMKMKIEEKAFNLLKNDDAMGK